MAKKVGLAVLGLGRMGSIHVKNLMQSPRASVKYVMDNRQIAENFVRDLNIKPQCCTPDQYDRILQDSGIDGVIVCTPTSEHENQIIAALKAGKGVLSEKPVTFDVGTTRSCYELAESVRRPLLCAFHRRFDPSFMAVKTKLTSKSLGRLRMLRSSSHDVNAPPVTYIQNSGGILKDSTVHDLDMVLWLSESPAKRVFAQGHAFDPAIKLCGDLDLVLVIIEHASGTLSVIDNGRRCAHGYDQRLEAVCDDGSLSVTNRHTDQCSHHTPTGSNLPSIDKLFDTRYREAYINEMEHFLDILTKDCPSKVTKSDIIAVMNLAEAATKSARSGHPVDLF